MDETNYRPLAYTTVEMAHLLGISPYTIRAWCKDGKLVRGVDFVIRVHYIRHDVRYTPMMRRVRVILPPGVLKCAHLCGLLDPPNWEQPFPTKEDK